MSLKLELQVVSSEPELPEQAEIQHWLNNCFPEQEGTVLVRIVDAEESAELNQHYRDKQGPTNVLSFPFDPPEGIEDDHLGDLVLCAPVIRTEANEQGKIQQHHWSHMLIHGVLHLLGYDHLDDSEAEEMEAMEIDLLSRLAIANPYE